MKFLKMYACVFSFMVGLVGTVVGAICVGSLIFASYPLLAVLYVIAIVAIPIAVSFASY